MMQCGVHKKFCVEPAMLDDGDNQVPQLIKFALIRRHIEWDKEVEGL